MNPFEQFGIKEVADVQFIALEDNERLGVTAGDIVLFLDTLKISTLEATAEQAEQRGGRGNPALIIWDYGREINVTLQDALFTPESLLVMTGGKKRIATGNDKVTISKTSLVTKVADLPSGTYKWISTTTGKRGVPAYAKTADQAIVAGKTYYTKVGEVYTAVAAPVVGDIGDYYEPTGSYAAPVAGDMPVRVFEDIEVNGTNGTAYEVTIDATNFPGTYKIIGETVVRSRTGKDTPFQFVIPKAKMGSEVTFTMEADGDPATFDLNLRVLRDDNGDMVKLIKYELNATP